MTNPVPPAPAPHGDRRPAPVLEWTAAALVDPLPLARALIQRQSVTPTDDGALDVLQAALTALGFRCRRMPFSRPDTPDVDNLYARRGKNGPNLCFAGHTDVVPVGHGWTRDPFAAEVIDGVLYGRGAADMKGAVACFVAACARYLRDSGADAPAGALSLMITGDEEGPALNGTKRMVETLASEGERVDHCLVGEPSCPDHLGEMIKVGRRGSLNVTLTVHGRQGHSAYPQRADNPIPRLMDMLAAITAEPLDTGSEHFQPSTLALTSVDVGNPATNVIPGRATARFNIRFNDQHTGLSLIRHMKAVFEGVQAERPGSFDMDVTVSGESFLTPPGPLSDLLVAAVEAETGRRPELSTSGGTSDARFIKDIAAVAEFGLVGRTIHQADEQVPVADLEALTEIYRRVIAGYFQG
ncbi:succinyl-diaminopimelate desuccinylase [Roseospira marina]|uniref:Succinyl-diaminopimelate desuccinylase n=1 Tax=Roseospira marina TaxID=140057 RepID=A0A5M6IC97_9PROT|nr:succinyl-diaminopimelate desuccinylase [Roseospira marina]MBB4314707.1 succinyl-diaminopimelate desuccinylase [Roseospira marina]MBB5087696.1 succinyl-diaminopimelate desuccinylase [Roseospira marina]